MKYVEFEKMIKDKEWSMTDLHSHNHYEIYFLVKGTRDFFLKDKMYKITSPCVIVIPPYTMHKTEGAEFTRINVNVTAETLNPYELSVLTDMSEKVITFPEKGFEEIRAVLRGAEIESARDDRYAKDVLNGYFSYLVILLDKASGRETLSPTTGTHKKASPVTLKIIDYISNNFSEKITLDDLSERFYLSKVSICSAFKRAMNCTVGEYLIRIRLNKAKQLLSFTKKSVEEIASLCGFSSGAYMGLIFKEKIGLSPLEYRKLQSTKD